VYTLHLKHAELMTQRYYKLLCAHPSSKLMQQQQFVYAILFLNTGHGSGKTVK
jgi:hypothetical protein